MSKIDDKILRTKYIRALEKFAFKASLLLKYEDFDAKMFQKNIIKNYTLLSKVKKVPLYSSYLNRLEKYVDFIFKSIDDIEDFESKKEILIKEANLLDKEKNSGKYKKDKYGSDFNDGY